MGEGLEGAWWKPERAPGQGVGGNVVMETWLWDYMGTIWALWISYPCPARTLLLCEQVFLCDPLSSMK